MYARGKFGIEYTPPEPKPESSWLGRILVVVACVIVFLVIRAIRSHIAAQRVAAQEVVIAETPATPAPPAADAQKAPAAQPRPNPVERISTSNRPVKIRNLLLRLSEAERLQDIEMTISTIEQLRASPDVADLDDTLARRLGVLNFRRLFTLKSAQWTTEVKVKHGDSATRIAYEHGSTLASLIKLNDDGVERLKVGRRLTVMNHPRFNLAISRRTRTADLMLNGKFFKRYYLTGEITGEVGSYATPERFRTFCTEKGVPFKPLDRAELEMLLPKSSPIYIKEI